MENPPPQFFYLLIFHVAGRDENLKKLFGIVYNNVLGNQGRFFYAPSNINESRHEISDNVVCATSKGSYVCAD